MTKATTYINKVLQFRLELDKSILISKLIANRDIGLKNYYMSILMVRYLNLAIAINRLLPQEEKEPSNIHSWDFGSIATLTRNFIETFHSFFYIGIEDIDNEEWNLRLKVFHLHDCSRRAELFKIIGETSQQEKFLNISKDLLNEIMQNKKFMTLNPDLQRRITKAETAFILGRQEIERRIDPTDSSIKLVYLFLSNQTHSFPMAYYRTENEGRGSSVENKTDKAYIILCLGWITDYLKKGNNYIKDKNILTK
jgi:hypothetical protein